MQKYSIWITGAKGKIGKALMPLLTQHQDYRIVPTDIDEVDITDLKAVKQASDLYRPTVIINLAGLSDAKYCEEHEVEAYKVNTLGARNLASVARKHNAKLIHISSDDVFCGEKNIPKNEFDIPTPNTIYGKSKLAGETLIRELNPKHLIIRSSWIYGNGGNKDYLQKILDLAKEGKTIMAPVDNISTPTSANALAEFIEKLITTEEYGIYHASCEGMCTRFLFATKIVELAGYDTSLVQPEFLEPGKTGVSTMLNNLMMKMTGIHTMPEWEEELVAYMNNR